MCPVNLIKIVQCGHFRKKRTAGAKAEAMMSMKTVSEWLERRQMQSVEHMRDPQNGSLHYTDLYKVLPISGLWRTVRFLLAF